MAWTISQSFSEGKMNQRVKDLWIDALNSGSYSQTEAVLRDEYGYCCLGVLCDIYRKDTGDGKWEEIEDCYNFIDKDDQEKEVLPKSVRDWAEIQTPDPKLLDNLTATEANDTFNMPFKDIAELLKTGSLTRHIKRRYGIEGTAIEDANEQ